MTAENNMSGENEMPQIADAISPVRGDSMPLAAGYSCVGYTNYPAIEGLNHCRRSALRFGQAIPEWLEFVDEGDAFYKRTGWRSLRAQLRKRPIQAVYVFDSCLSYARIRALSRNFRKIGIQLKLMTPLPHSPEWRRLFGGDDWMW